VIYLFFIKDTHCCYTNYHIAIQTRPASGVDCIRYVLNIAQQNITDDTSLNKILLMTPTLTKYY
jgi:hypothetical protein